MGKSKNFKFPERLLSAPIGERFAYFEGKTIKHPILGKCYEKIIRAVNPANSGVIIFVIGPTGVGKTTLRLKYEQEIAAISANAMKEDPGHIPVISIVANAPENGNFNWKEHYIRFLGEANEPMIEQKRKSLKRRSAHESFAELGLKKNAVATEFRQALESCIIHRRTRVCIIDEAQHINKVSSGRRLLDQMDLIKSLANNTGVPHILFGTYELLTLAGLSAQLNRRSIDIHFPRYPFNPDDKSDPFLCCIRTFQETIPISHTPDLIDLYDFLYAGTAGCVGLLKNWLDRALFECLDHGEEVLSKEMLESTVMPPNKMIAIAEEIKRGEERFNHDPSEEVRKVLGMDTTLVAQLNEGPTVPRRRRVGTRNPARDLVGNRKHGF